MVRYRSSVTANMNLIGERFFWYRYRVQCDRGFTDVHKLSVLPTLPIISYCVSIFNCNVFGHL